jgi:hypothetical protein
MHLVRRLGEVECRDCGDVREPAAAAAAGVGPVPGVTSAAPPGPLSGGDQDFGATPGLAEEVELAVARVLGRAGKPARIG